MTSPVIPPLEPNYRARLQAALSEAREIEKALVLLIDQRGGNIDVARVRLRHLAEYLGPEHLTGRTPPPPPDTDCVRR